MEDEEVQMWCAALCLYITNQVTQGAAREESRYPGKCSLHGVSSVPGKHKDLASILSMESKGGKERLSSTTDPQMQEAWPSQGHPGL